MKYILVVVAGLTLAQSSFTEDQANLAPSFSKFLRTLRFGSELKTRSPVRQPMLVTTFKWKY